MSLEKLSLSSNDFKIIGSGKVLPYLRDDLSHAEKSLLIVGPWIDGYFVQQVIDSLPNKKLEVKFIVRIDGSDEIDSKTLSALNLARKNFSNCEAKTLEKLHSKVIVIDDDIFYLGSTNWYWYSLIESIEVTIRSKTSIAPELMEELNEYWKNGAPISRDKTIGHEDIKPIKEEIDEYARKVLEED